MEHPNAKLAREIYDAFARGDMDAIRDKYFSPDITFYVPGDSAISGEYHGFDEVIGGLFAKVFQLSEGNFRLDIHDVTASDDHAVGLTDGIIGRDGKEHRYHNIHVLHFKDGKLIELYEHPEIGKYNAVWHR